MDIAILIIASLTLIAVGIGLFLNHKSTLKHSVQLTGIEAKIVTNKLEILEKISALKEKTEQLATDLSTKISNVKTDLLDASNKTQQEIENGKKQIVTSFEKTETEIRSKIEEALKANEQKQTELVKDVTEKFNKIVEEINKPLTLD